MKIYHNPKFSKSRTAKKMLDESGVSYETCLYMDNPLSVVELNQLLQKLKLQIFEIIRTKESIWKENFKDHEYSDEELIKIVSDNIKLLERPIIEHKDKAVIARSDEAIEEIIAYN
jgi:arsenate reductase